ncbi:DUF4167 domain-containing protein [Novosphingobium sp. G106]|uniref:DUF4167 domain-containing protein n=1 Tax=Novosphingobium sp. G106 TaxID=2849500 RepID=UPI001C2D73A7|nr:DUF4167 domain-containing protein [Novosphingobium sp. G106]MBV1690238.1 DUF4167 domain-containing protein [Novosphingobium sp. G106]
MNNNRGNNRRRGRGNNNNRQQGGGQNVNRIDSRARGNAPQLLEKYRKLAHDAHLNGDRVQEEYYLQFADHYFRVLADQRQRQEESRQPRTDRWQEGGEGERERDESEYGSEYAADDYTAYDQPHRREREDRPQRQDDRPVQSGPRERPERSDRPERTERQPEQRRDTASDDTTSDDSGSSEAAEQRSPYEPPENPFVRGSRGLKPRREDRRPRRESNDSDNDAPQGFDPSILPPAISAGREESVEVPAEAAPEPEAKPRRAPRARRPKPPAGETLETVD